MIAFSSEANWARTFRDGRDDDDRYCLAKGEAFLSRSPLPVGPTRARRALLSVCAPQASPHVHIRSARAVAGRVPWPLGYV